MTSKNTNRLNRSAGQEGAVQAHQLELEQRVEVHAGAVPARGGIDQRRRPAHELVSTSIMRRQAVEPPARCRTAPASCPAGRRRCVGPAGGLLVGPAQQGHGHQQAEQSRSTRLSAELERAAALRAAAASARRSAWQQDGRQHQVRHAAATASFRASFIPRLPCRPHGRCPISPREASSTTRNSAVMAKPITMAVSTSACGMGSA